jgi:hypothetical protein
MRIGIDLDGVIFDFVTAFNQATMEILGIKLPEYDREYFPTRWDWAEQFLDEDQNNVIWTYITSSDKFWTNIPPFEWSKKALNILFGTPKHDIYFVTCRMSNNFSFPVKVQSENGLKKLQVKNPTVLPVNEYDDKYFLVRGLHLDVFVDDKTETLNLLQEDCANTRVVCLSQPWNTDFHGEHIMDLPLFLSSL